MFANLQAPKLLPLPFRLPQDVGLKDVGHFQTLAQRLDQKVIRGPANSAPMINRIAEFERLRVANCRQLPQCLLRAPRDVRLLIGWWSGDPQTRLAWLPMSVALLDRCIALKPQLSLQALFGLIRLFFECFDEIEELALLGQLLQQQLELRGRSSGPLSSLAVLTLNRQDLFCPDGPKRLVAMTTEKNRTLDAVADQLGVTGHASGRFYQHCQQLYYLETLSGLEVGQDHEILHELARREVYGAPFNTSLLLGHEVVRRMVDNAAGRGELPDKWLNLILTIAGDPRVSKRSATFTKWWALLDQAHVTQVRRWLSHMDLRLFLKVLEEYSDHAGADMQRMFPARERFLRGLFDAELIRDSRLFLSHRADQFVRRYYRDQNVPTYATNSDAEISVFYLNIDGVEVFEGTHAFKFWIYRELPPTHPGNNDEVTRFKIHDLRQGLDNKVVKNGLLAGFGVVHNPNVTWQHKVITKLSEFGVNIDPASVLTREDYKIYRNRHGIQAWL